MSSSSQVTGYSFSADDPLADAHRLVAAWIDEVVSLHDGYEYYREVELGRLPSGRPLLEAKPDQARRYVMAAVAQLRYWDEMVARIRDQAEDESHGFNQHLLPGWEVIWGRRQQTMAVLRPLLRRKLPLSSGDFVAILHWCSSTSNLSTYIVPVASIIKALERHVVSEEPDDELRAAARSFAMALRASHDKHAQRLATSVEQIGAGGEDGVDRTDLSEPALPPPVSATEAVAQLALLKVRVKFGTAQKEIEKAFNVAAAALGLPRDEIEELGVPSYGLDPFGRREEVLGDYRVELVVNSSQADLNWYDAKGKALKSAPAKARKEHKEDLKELQQALKDVQGMLPAQRDRVDGLFLLQRSWPMKKWRECYLDQPLVGTIARRLLWCIDGTPAIFVDGEILVHNLDIVGPLKSRRR